MDEITQSTMERAEPRRGAETDPVSAAVPGSQARWRDLVCLSADFVFETDQTGRLTFVAPEQPLGWPAALLLGQPATILLPEGEDTEPAAGNPFSPATPQRAMRIRLRRGDGRLASVRLCVASLADGDGVPCGSRGIVFDLTEQDDRASETAAALRRVEMFDHILAGIRQETLAPRMMQTALDGLLRALEAEGAAVLDLLRATPSQATLHQVGSFGAPGQQALAAGFGLLRAAPDAEPITNRTPTDRTLLACPILTRFGEHAGLVLWRAPLARAGQDSVPARDWDAEDRSLAAAAGGIIRMVLEHESIQREMALQSRTDALTGLLNRRAFLEDTRRRLDRLDREELPGTLMFIDLDNFKQMNDRLGHGRGDEALCALARMLEACVRPGDLVSRLGGDEFALWLDGSDEMTAAERAEALVHAVPAELMALIPAHALEHGAAPVLSLSIGIARRTSRSGESIDSLLQRADRAMYDVKRAGRGHWRVSLSEPDM